MGFRQSLLTIWWASLITMVLISCPSLHNLSQSQKTSVEGERLSWPTCAPTWHKYRAPRQWQKTIKPNSWNVARPQLSNASGSGNRDMTCLTICSNEKNVSSESSPWVCGFSDFESHISTRFQFGFRLANGTVDSQLGSLDRLGIVILDSREKKIKCDSIKIKCVDFCYWSYVLGTHNTRGRLG